MQAALHDRDCPEDVVTPDVFGTYSVSNKDGARPDIACVPAKAGAQYRVPAFAGIQDRYMPEGDGTEYVRDDEVRWNTGQS